MEHRVTIRADDSQITQLCPRRPRPVAQWLKVVNFCVIPPNFAVNLEEIEAAGLARQPAAIGTLGRVQFRVA
jgi:hypothetical protein